MRSYAGSPERKIKIVGGKEVCPDKKLALLMQLYVRQREIRKTESRGHMCIMWETK